MAQGESVDEGDLPVGATFGTSNVEGYVDSDDDDFEDEEPDEGALADLKAELSALKMSELKKRARTAGVTHEQLDAADDLADPKGAVIGILLTHKPVPAMAAVESTPVAPEPEEEDSTNGGVAMTPEQVEFRSHMKEFRNIAADLGHASLAQGQEAWDAEEEAGLVWSHATRELSEQEARGADAPTTMEWLLTGWTEESAALGTCVQAPFDRWCPTTAPGGESTLPSACGWWHYV